MLLQQERQRAGQHDEQGQRIPGHHEHADAHHQRGAQGDRPRPAVLQPLGRLAGQLHPLRLVAGGGVESAGDLEVAVRFPGPAAIDPVQRQPLDDVVADHEQTLGGQLGRLADGRLTDDGAVGRRVVAQRDPRRVDGGDLDGRVGAGDVRRAQDKVDQGSRPMVVVVPVRTQAQAPALGPASTLSVPTASSGMVNGDGPGVPMVSTQPGVIGDSANVLSRVSGT